MRGGGRTQGAPGEGLGLTLAGLVTASLAYALMQTFLIPALPVLQRDLQTSTGWVTWTITAYLLTGVVATPLMSRLGDQHGKVRMMLVSLGIFLVGSLAAVVAWDVASLIACRAVQGVGAAVFPLSFGIIRDQFPAERRSVAMGLVSAVLGVGGGIGIALSGVIVDHASWRWLFVASAVLLAVAIVLVWRFVPESTTRAPARLDLPGAALLSGGLVALLLAITQGPVWGWVSAPVVGLATLAGVLLVAWGWVERRSPAPLVDMAMLARRPVLFTNLAALLSGFALYMTWVILPTFFQLPRGLPEPLAGLADYGFGTTVTVAGLWILPTSASILLAGPVAGLIGRRHGSRGPLVAGLVMLAAGSAGIALWHASPWQVAIAFSVSGWGIGFAFAAMPRLITDAVEPSETGIANGMNTVIRTLGGVIGAQVAATLLAVSSVGGAAAVPAESGFVAAFWVSVVGALVGALAAALVFPWRPHRPARSTPDRRRGRGRRRVAGRLAPAPGVRSERG